MFVGSPSSVKALVWQGHRNPVWSPFRLMAHPRWGHSVWKAMTFASRPGGWRMSQTEPTGSRG